MRRKDGHDLRLGSGLLEGSSAYENPYLVTLKNQYALHVMTAKVQVLSRDAKVV